jgi:hypothetical protein
MNKGFTLIDLAIRNPQLDSYSDANCMDSNGV